MHPEVAFRSCDDCRKWYYDEETGEPRVSVRTGERLERLKESTLLCVMDKCPKGHYSKPIELSEADRQVVDLYRAAKATGGAVLNEEERRDNILKLVFGQLDVVFASAERAQLTQSLAAMVLRAR